MLDTKHVELMCHHCGALMRRQSPDVIGADDVCLVCHYHLHRCENCRYSDSISCMLNRPEQQSPVPGQHCPAFSYRSVLPHHMG